MSEAGMESTRPLRILFVEDIPEECELAVYELRQADLQFEFIRVDTREAFLAALAEFRPDIVVSDYAMPRFDGMKALGLSQAFDPALPFIILTGSKNEETAVICLKSGASDYVIKGHISRLPFAVREALAKAQDQAEKEAVLAALRESEENFRALANSGQALIWTSRADRGRDYFNETWFEFTGRTYEEEAGEAWLSSVHPDERAACARTYEDAFERRAKYSMEYRLRRCDGAYRWVQDDACPRFDPRGTFLGYIGHCLDVTERKLAEQGIREALEEKELLLRELFHRTRNNMQVIMAILAFEEDRVNDEEARILARRTSERILSMSLVHKLLYESKDLSRIDFKDYLEGLVEHLEQNGLIPKGRVSVSIAAESVRIFVDIAVPFGLIVQELLSNALHHAFPEGRRGEVRIELSRTPQGGLELGVFDDGVGVQGTLDFGRKDTLGLRLVQVLAEGQLRGTVRGEYGKGLAVRVSIPDAPSMKRV